MEKLCEKHSVLEAKFMKYQKKILIENRSYPLDIIMNINLDKNKT